VAAEVLLAILISALAVLGLPRERVRTNLTAASRLGRVQYGLLLGPSFTLVVGETHRTIYDRVAVRGSSSFMAASVRQ